MRLLLDPVEPRVLLNADTLTVQLAALPDDAQSHDVLVQMVQDTVTVGAQTQTVQRVQVLDADHGKALLAFGDLSEINSIAIAGVVNTVTLDLGSFGASAAPSIRFDGAPAQNTLAVIGAAAPQDWRVNGDGSGTVGNSSFAGVGTLRGAGADTLHGPATDTTWQITGAGRGSLMTDTGGPITRAPRRRRRQPGHVRHAAGRVVARRPRWRRRRLRHFILPGHGKLRQQHRDWSAFGQCHRGWRDHRI